MIVDAELLPDGHRIEAEIVVVGSGPAGITLARELIGSSARVAILEGGGADYTVESQGVYRGEVVGWPVTDLTTCRMRYLGGTSNVWTGFCRPFESIDFEPRPGIPYGGWPISLDELSPFYQRAVAVVQVGEARFDVDYWSARSGLSPWPLDGDLIETKLSQFSNPTRFGKVYRDEIESAENVTLYLNANVLRLLPTRDGTHVEQAEIATYGESRLSAHGDLFVVACGGLENPRLLLNSPGATDRGLANGSDMVGRFFSAHYTVDTCSLLLPEGERPPPLYMLPVVDAPKLGVPDPTPLRLRGYLCVPEERSREEGLANMNCELYPVDPWAANGQATRSLQLLLDNLKRFEGAEFVPRHLQRVIDHLPARWREPAETAIAGEPDLGRSYSESGYYILHNYVEHLPNPHSRIRLARSTDRFGMRRLAVDVQFSEAENRSMERFLQLLAQSFGKADIGRVRIDLPRDRVQVRGGGATHHHGTTRMHEDPRLGVVDADCRAHEVDNLYLAGSSVFTRCGVWNPTLTIIAMTLRLAEHLKRAYHV